MMRGGIGVRYFQESLEHESYKSMFLDATREATLRDCWACYLDHALPGACTRQMKVDVGPRETAFHEMARDVHSSRLRGCCPCAGNRLLTAPENQDVV